MTNWITNPWVASSRVFDSRPDSGKIIHQSTITGLRISAVDGTAFVDNGSAITTYADGNHQVSIFDSSGRELRGVLKAAGSGETLGSELVANGGFDSNTTGWVAENSAVLASVAGGQDGNCLRITENGANDPYTSQALSVTGGTLYKFNYAVKQGTNSTYRGFLIGTGVISPTIPSFVNRTSTSAWVFQGPAYTTAIASGSAWVAFRNITSSGSGLTHLFDSATLKQVTAPSSDGATIVSAKGGTTYNFSYKDASFSFNAASYNVVVRRIN